MLLVIDVISDADKSRFWPEVRVDDGITVSDLKDKLYIKTGTSPLVMDLYAFHPGNPESKIFLDDDLKSLDQYSIFSGFTIQVSEAQNKHTFDVNGASAGPEGRGVRIDYSGLASSNPRMYEHYMRQMEKSEGEIDESNFEKYEMSDEDYLRRNTGLRDFIQRMRTKGDSKSRVWEGAVDLSQRYADLGQLRSMFPLESRCRVSPGDRRGCVKFVGHVDAKNVRIGVCLDEPLGDSDGSWDFRRFFDAGPNYAGFFHPEDVEVGDFPPLDPFDIAK